MGLFTSSLSLHDMVTISELPRDTREQDSHLRPPSSKLGALSTISFCLLTPTLEGWGRGTARPFMRPEGIEPTLRFQNQILSLARLPSSATGAYYKDWNVRRR